MLTRLVALLVAGTAGSALADGAPRPSGVVPLRQLTAGESDQFSGALLSDGASLLFASNVNGTVELFSAPLGVGAPTLFFDERADVAQPKVSPDGKHLLYLSYRDDAFGDACVLTLPGKARRCFEGGGAVLHAFWFPDGRRVGLVTRAELDAPWRVVSVPLDAPVDARGTVLREGFFLAPTIAPDERWLVAVPATPATDGGTRTLPRAVKGLLLLPVDGGEARTFFPALPGASASPAFSPDGRYLYFTQFPDDSDADGVADGADHGVLVRVPWKGADTQPHEVEVLTSPRDNCQEPSPQKTLLLATCARRGVLQVMSLPLDGQVPASMTKAQLDAEADAARSRWDRMLLQERRLELETEPAQRLRLERRMAMSHLELGAFDSAEFDLELMQQDAGVNAFDLSWATVAIELVQHRRAEARLPFGKLSDRFIAREKERLMRLQRFVDDAQPTLRRFSRLVRAEVLRTLGLKGDALLVFETLDVEAETDVDVLLLWGRLSERMYRDLDERTKWSQALLKLSAHPALSERERLHQARRFVDVLTRGRNAEQRRVALEAVRPALAPGSDALLLLDVELALDRVTVQTQRDAVPALDALWTRADSFESHREVAMTIIEHAAHEDFELLLDEYGRRWLDAVPVEHPERKYAEALYAEVRLEHAYVELHAARLDAAAALFLDIVKRTRSLEAISGFVEANARAKVDEKVVVAALDDALPGERNVGWRAYGAANVVARSLSALDDAHVRDEVVRATRLLEPALEPLSRTTELHHLLGYLAHELFHRFDARPSALEAHRRYHLALDLAPDVYRRRASLLLELGLLQAALGNHRIALKHFAERERLPFVRDEEALAFRLARARSFFNIGDDARAAEEAQLAVLLVDANPDLEPFRALALERAVFSHLVAKRYFETGVFAAQLKPLLPQSTAAQVKVRLAQASALLHVGDGESAGQVLQEARDVLDAKLPVHTTDALSAHGPTHLTVDDLRALVAGLDAEAQHMVKDGPKELVALAERDRLLVARNAAAPRDETLYALMQTSTRQAHTSATLKRWKDVRAFLVSGFEREAAWRASVGTQLSLGSVALYTLCAEVSLLDAQACPKPRAEVRSALLTALEQARRQRFEDAQSLRLTLPTLLARLPDGD